MQSIESLIVGKILWFIITFDLEDLDSSTVQGSKEQRRKLVYKAFWKKRSM